jgi:hypothetical protein
MSQKAYWKRAAKAQPGLTPATPLQTATMDPSGLLSLTDLPVGSLLRHEDLWYIGLLNSNSVELLISTAGSWL